MKNAKKRTIKRKIYPEDKPKTVDLLIETELEMKKVSWPTIEEAMSATWVVAFVTLLLTASLFFFDFLLASFFGFIF